MAHELEQDKETGRWSFVSANGQPAWHRLGQVFGEPLTADQALDEANLRGWDVQKVPNLVNLSQMNELGVYEEVVGVPGSFTVTRLEPGTKRRVVIGNPSPSVGSAWTPFQNEQAVAFLSAVTDEYSDARYETAGSIRLGSQVFVSIHLKDFLVGGVDGMKLYLVYVVNHLTGANLCYVTHIRPVCANTVDYGSAQARFTFRHTSGIAGAHSAARSALQLSWNFNSQFHAQAEAMISEQMMLDGFREVCAEIWPAPEPEAKDHVKRKWSERKTVLENLFLFSDTQEGVRNTRWGAFNALVEYADHASPVSAKLSPEQAEEVRALRTIDGGPKTADGKVTVKLRAFELLKV